MSLGLRHPQSCRPSPPTLDLAAVEAYRACVTAGVSVHAAAASLASERLTGIAVRIDRAARHLADTRRRDDRAWVSMREAVAIDVKERTS